MNDPFNIKMKRDNNNNVDEQNKERKYSVIFWCE